MTFVSIHFRLAYKCVDGGGNTTPPTNHHDDIRLGISNEYFRLLAILYRCAFISYFLNDCIRLTFMMRHLCYISVEYFCYPSELLFILRVFVISFRMPILSGPMQKNNFPNFLLPLLFFRFDIIYDVTKQ